MFIDKIVCSKRIIRRSNTRFGAYRKRNLRLVDMRWRSELVRLRETKEPELRCRVVLQSYVD